MENLTSQSKASTTDRYRTAARQLPPQALSWLVGNLESAYVVTSRAIALGAERVQDFVAERDIHHRILRARRLAAEAVEKADGKSTGDQGKVTRMPSLKLVPVRSRMRKRTPVGSSAEPA